MLSQVRDALKGVLAWVVVALLILAFAMFGVPEMRDFTGGSFVKVGKQSFSKNYVVNEFDTAFQRQSRESSGALTREQAVASGLPNQIVDGITTKSAIAQYADKMNLALPRSAVAHYLQNSGNLKNPATGRFDKVYLETLLQNNSLTVEAFESIIKDDLARSQLIGSLAASGTAPKRFTDAMLLRDTERRRIAYLTVTDEMAGMAAEPTPNDLETYYKENESAFTAPEYRTFDLLVLRNDNFHEGLEAPEEEIRRLYDAGKTRLYDKPERRTIHQLTYQDEAEAAGAAASLRQGTPFENLASNRGMSLDAATLTDVEKSRVLDPTVAEAAFAQGLEDGAILDPVRSLFGWTVVQIAGITPAQSRSYEDVREEIVSDFLEQDVRRRMQNAIDEIEEVRDTGADLTEAAEAAGLKAETFGPVDRLSFAPGGAIIGKIPGEALSEAFMLDEGEQSEAMRLSSQDGYLFVALREITPPALKPFDYVRDEVEQKWRDQERRQRISSAVKTIRNEVAAGGTFEAVASQLTRTPIEVVIDRRFENENISRSVNEQIFFADLNDLISGPAGTNGAQVVVQVREIGFGRNQVSPAEEEQLRQLIGYQINQELIDAFLLSIRQDYGVTLDQAQLDALFADGL